MTEGTNDDVPKLPQEAGVGDEVELDSRGQGSSEQILYS